MTAVVYRLDTYGAWLYLARSRAELAGLRRKMSMDAISSAEYGASYLVERDKAGNPGPFLVMYVDVEKHDGHAQLVDTIAHETMHTCLSLFERIGEKAIADCEPLAYLAGFIAAWAFDHCQP